MQKKTILALIACCALALVVGASFAVYRHTQSDIPDEKTMARLLADLYVADAALQDYIYRGKDDKLQERTYHTVLSHYGISKAQYDSAIAFYSRDAKLFSAVYDRTVAILSEKEDRLSENAQRADSIAIALAKANDSITTHLLCFPQQIRLPLNDDKDTLKSHLHPKKKYDRISFSTKIDSMKGGRITLKEKYLITSKKMTADSAYIYMTITYADSTTSTDSMAVDAKRIMYQREAVLTSYLKDSATAVRIDATPLSLRGMHDAVITLRDIQLFHKPYDIIDSTTNDPKQSSMFTF